LILLLILGHDLLAAQLLLQCEASSLMLLGPRKILQQHLLLLLLEEVTPVDWPQLLLLLELQQALPAERTAESCSCHLLHCWHCLLLRQQRQQLATSPSNVAATPCLADCCCCCQQH
jgi:hypothetical protein